MLGGTKNGFVALMLASVPPEASAFSKAALELAANEDTLPAAPGASVPGPTTNEVVTGGLVRSESATVAGKRSVKMPNPPRNTRSLLPPNGWKAKPILG